MASVPTEAESYLQASSVCINLESQTKAITKTEPLALAQADTRHILFGVLSDAADSSEKTD